MKISILLFSVFLYGCLPKGELKIEIPENADIVKEAENGTPPAPAPAPAPMPIEPPSNVQYSPGHIRAMYKSDPATSIVVGWNRYETKASENNFYYDSVDHGRNIGAYPNKPAPHYSSEYESEIKNAFVELKNLKPETTYYFVIKNSFVVSKRYYFQTLPNIRNTRLSIIAGGDSRNNRTPRKGANSLVRKLKPHFVHLSEPFFGMKAS